MIIRSPSRDVGQLAEATFARLCANEPGTVANKAYNDQTGWDFLVEFLDTALLGLPNASFRWRRLRFRGSLAVVPQCRVSRG